jgi:hypothetical protein
MIVLAYVAAIALLVVGIVSIFKAWDDAKRANQQALDDISEALKEFSDLADSAKESLEEISEEKTGL